MLSPPLAFDRYKKLCSLGHQHFKNAGNFVQWTRRDLNSQLFLAKEVFSRLATTRPCRSPYPFYSQSKPQPLRQLHVA